MKLPQNRKRITQIIIVIQILISLSLLAGEQMKIIIVPVKGSSDISEGDVKQVTKTIGNSFCDKGNQLWACVDRGAGFKTMFDEAKLGQQGVTQQAIQIGKAYGANYALIAAVGKLSSGSYTLSVELIQLESVTKVPIGLDVRTKTIDELFDIAKETLGPDLVEKFTNIAGTKQ